MAQNKGDQMSEQRLAEPIERTDTAGVIERCRHCDEQVFVGDNLFWLHWYTADRKCADR